MIVSNQIDRKNYYYAKTVIKHLVYNMRNSCSNEQITVDTCGIDFDP